MTLLLLHLVVSWQVFTINQMYECGSVVLWWHCDMLCAYGFVDGVMIFI